MEIFLTIEIILKALNLSEQEYKDLLETRKKGIFTQARFDKVISELRRNCLSWFDTDESEIDWKHIPRQIKRMLSANPPQKVSIGKHGKRKRSRSGKLNLNQTLNLLIFKRQVLQECHLDQTQKCLTRNSRAWKTSTNSD